ncbi:MAG: CbiX/SirB N-terminal domain-containing protein [Candidatus Hatepunaea meridiana]|nr:CbiX/SirB N-terminal domain-containing protein [Candidatus Hatepunaea meridiana]
MKTGLLLTALLMLSLSITAIADDKSALMIVAHGAPGENWNKLSRDVCDEVRQLADQRDLDAFDEIKLAFLEFAKPSIFSVVEEFEGANITKAFVVPLFIAPSGHSGRDLPAALGIYSDPDIMETLKVESVKIPDTRIKFVVGQPLFPGDIIPQIALDRVRELSTNPEREAVVVMAHGDDYYGRYWDDLVHETGSYICGKLGIEKHRGVFIHIGQSFSANGLTEIQRTLDKKETVIVANIFLSLDLKEVAGVSVLNFMGNRVTGEQILKGKDVRYCRGLLPDSRVAEWILDSALKMMTPPHEFVEKPLQRKPNAANQDTKCYHCHSIESWNPGYGVSEGFRLATE